MVLADASITVQGDLLTMKSTARPLLSANCLLQQFLAPKSVSISLCIQCIL